MLHHVPQHTVSYILGLLTMNGQYNLLAASKQIKTQVKENWYLAYHFKNVKAVNVSYNFSYYPCFLLLGDIAYT